MTDLQLAKKFLARHHSASTRGLEFSLSFMAFKNIMSTKKCKYTGIVMTSCEAGKQRPTDLTLERIDNTKGYVQGNVIAVCFAANQIKAVWENPNNILTAEMVEKIASANKP